MSWIAFEAVKRHSPQKATPKLVLSYIAHDIYEKDDGIARLTYRELMETTGVTERFLRSVIGGLVRAGELIVFVRAGDVRGNVYAIPLYPGETGYQPPVPCERADGHYCNGFHAQALVNRERLKAEKEAAQAPTDRKRANRAKQEYYARPRTTTRREQQPDAMERPAADVARQRGGQRLAPADAAALDSAIAALRPEGGYIDVTELTESDREEIRERQRHILTPRKRPGAGPRTGASSTVERSSTQPRRTPPER